VFTYLQNYKTYTIYTGLVQSRLCTEDYTLLTSFLVYHGSFRHLNNRTHDRRQVWASYIFCVPKRQFRTRLYILEDRTTHIHHCENMTLNDNTFVRRLLKHLFYIRYVYLLMKITDIHVHILEWKHKFGHYQSTSQQIPISWTPWSLWLFCSKILPEIKVKLGKWIVRTQFIIKCISILCLIQ
jgi:hypothetical protein